MASCVCVFCIFCTKITIIYDRKRLLYYRICPNIIHANDASSIYVMYNNIAEKSHISIIALSLAGQRKSILYSILI